MILGGAGGPSTQPPHPARAPAPCAARKVLEFNCRFGDPETQVIVPLMDSDLMDAMEACVGGTLADCDIRFSSDCCATVVGASEGYPGSYPKGRVISGLDAVEMVPGATCFLAGVRARAERLRARG